MKVRVRFFGAPREAVGSPEIEQELPPGSSAAQLMNVLIDEYPVLRAYSHSVNIAVNRKYVAVETELHEGDEVAYMPPVAGG